MAQILSESVCKKIRKIRSDKKVQAVQEKGWLCEGSDDGLVFFNNRTDEYIETNIYVCVLDNRLTTTNLCDIMPFIEAECMIAQLVQ